MLPTSSCSSDRGGRDGPPRGGGRDGRAATASRTRSAVVRLAEEGAADEAAQADGGLGHAVPGGGFADGRQVGRDGGGERGERHRLQPDLTGAAQLGQEE